MLATVASLLAWTAPVPSRRDACDQVPIPSRRDALAAAAAVMLPAQSARATYGEFAKVAGTQNGAAGDPENECLFAMPGTGVCTVFRSSEPLLYASPDFAKATNKLVKAAQQLDGLGALIDGGKWTAISQCLGASRDLREAVSFLTASSPGATAAAKKLFRDLDGVQLATQKKDKAIATKYFSAYAADMPALLAQLR